ncbi:hypothetical protein A2962_04820 [Candidatus Woesebacteria bacterium RIFCSPLOWO2_01_FULL_39_61]|uniref:Phosphoglycerate mutase n=1 Tax=Candidatus Woesebacteria bacterium RIFCSPHIGHO2_02_FULL_39_13 TaxID=1802505 RepID=A0A1F7Z3X7_9BACT|nr:MAG: hypothetical protein A2692_01140 [Candidatus Woesebacteria bacterium RIFCSPHIGHO2_01_FULL_39_95]OGM34322.1 MAG: hypothetical protein A3D01_00945 [Candidatus Woesebacteria bacterium RIFCSPHIGHO2_02_FULL_39_13]OGM39104.1 MAG: hypothetical protein A3E13_01670 [Candidatus Woesebacteria bacterium RIFCSPHIGHO2_12_FULL_40_20]OGM68659.1 MAG: hypothetical protein A2962_04820 [Candidatus Woesebacteria bacterium RIFCSPLOWO2_01_FULL_39_61]OGM73515.1 MAG: hypothetical protein A3H19_00415 [Candidatus
METKLILVRHGETDINVGGKMHKVSDPERLNRNGREQITKAAKKLKDIGIDCVYASSEKRANESAKIISKICKVSLQFVEGVEERNWGEYSNTTWPELKVILDHLTYKQRFAFKPPGGESLTEFEERLGKAIKTIINLNRGKKVALVSHGGAIRVMIGFLLNLPPKDRFKLEPPNASITILNHDEKHFKPQTFLSTTHLA